MRKSLICWAAAVCLLGSANMAQAATVLVSFSGTSNGSSEHIVGGFWGSSTTVHSFVDEPFTATIEMDTNQGLRFDSSLRSEVTGSVNSARFTSVPLTRTLGPSEPCG